MSVPNGLDFERPIQDLETKIQELEAFQVSKGVDLSETIDQLRDEQRRVAHTIYADLTPWQEVTVARHPGRPSTVDFVAMVFDDFVELHGDRLFGNDRAVLCGLARLGDQRVMVIGHRKGKNTRERVACHMGMPHPEGYRKAMLKARLAERFGLPIIMFIDTPGAYPGDKAEERGIAQSIAENIADLSTLRVPILCVVVGEGASGGALGIGVGDRMVMLEHAFLSVISPEGCAAILFRSRDKKEQAADALRLTTQDILELGIADEIVPEPDLGAHREPQAAADRLVAAIKRHMGELLATPIDDLLEQRYQRYRRLGAFVSGDSSPS